MSCLLLESLQNPQVGRVVGGHDQVTDRVLQNRLQSRVRGAVGKQQSSSDHADDEAEHLGTGKLKGRRLGECVARKRRESYHQQRHWVLHQSTAAAEEGSDHDDDSERQEDVDSNVEHLDVQHLDPLVESWFGTDPHGHREQRRPE